MAAPAFTPLAVADASRLSEVALQAYRDHYLDYWHDRGEWYMDHSFAPAVLATELADPNARWFSISCFDYPVGFLKINLDKDLPSEPSLNGLELERIYLTRAATGSGIGKAALAFTESIAREHRKHLVWLKAMDTSDALGFYRRMGFAVCGSLQLSFPQMKEERRGMVILKKML